MWSTLLRSSITIMIAVSLLLLIDSAIAKSAAITLDEEMQNFELDAGSDTTFRKLFESARFERALSAEVSGDVRHNQKTFLHVILCQFLLGKFEEGITTSEKWLVANKSAPEASISFVYEFIGICHMNSGEYQKALDAFVKAKKIFFARNVDSRSQEATDYLAIKEGKLTQKEFLEKQWSLRPGLEADMKIACHRCGLAPMIEFQPSTKFPGKGDSTAWAKSLNLAQHAKKLDLDGAFGRASILYKDALKTYDSDPETWSAFALSAMLSGEEGAIVPSELENAFQKPVELDPENWRYWNNLGVYRFIRGSTKDSADAFQRALDCKGVPKHQEEGIRANLKVAGGAAAMKKYFEGFLDGKLKKLKVDPSREK